MKRYSWVALLCAVAMAGAAYGADTLAADFKHPPASAKPGTFWFWMNGNVTADGITRDLEAMQRAGVGGFFAYDGSTYLPAGPAGYLQPHWRALMTHAIKEANRLGLKPGLQNGPGWSSSGGPWISPKQSMQQVVWTETTLQGGRSVELALTQPQTNLGYYEDAAVLAFPAQPGEEIRYEDEIARITRADGSEIPVEIWSDGQLSTAVSLADRASVVIEFKRPVTLHALSAWPGSTGSFAPLQIEASLDGKAYTPVVNVSAPGRHGIVGPAVRNFSPVAAKFVRLVPTRAGVVGELQFHRTPRTTDWAAKANFDYRVSGQLVLPKDVTSGIDPRTVVDLTSQMRDGTLRWDAPPGAWTVLRVGHTTTGKENVAASAAGRGLECDKMDPAGIERHFDQVITRIEADAAAAGVKGPAAIEIDSYEAGMQNWTRNFPAEFQRRTGYALLPFVPAIFGRIVGDSRLTERFLYDFRRVQADLMADYYYGRAHELVRARGMTFYVEGYGVGNFDELRISGLPDVPMTEFWTRTPWTPNRSVKMVTSAAHVYGKPIVAAEAFTGEFRTSRWLEYPYALKILGDEMTAHGVNQFYFHRFAHQPHPDAAPGMAMGPYGFFFDRTNTWFAQSTGWLEYLARTHQVLRQGTYVADVLYFTGERAPDPSQMAIPVLPPGYTYDVVNTDVLLTRVTVEHGDYVLPEGGRYKLLVLPPDARGMRPELVAKLREFVENGANLLGPAPEFSPTLSGYPQSESQMLTTARALWNPQREGPGRVWTGQSIGDVLSALKLAPDFGFASSRPDTALAWQHRALADGDLYFVANRQRRIEEVVLSLRGMSGRQPEIWRAERTSMSDAVVFAESNGRAQVPVRLEPGEAVFVLFRRPAGPARAAVLKDGLPVQTTTLATAEPAVPANTFTMAIWVKPDTDLRVMPKESVEGRIDEVGKFYAIPADPGDVRFGPGAATAGLAVGRNGIYVVERSQKTCPAVLVSTKPVSGWTHVAVVYRDGKPALFVNGELVREGLASGRKVYCGVGSPPPPVDYMLHFPAIEALTRAANQPAPPSRGNVFYFEGNSVPPESFDRALSAEEIRALVAAGVPPPPTPILTELGRAAKEPATALVWESGRYQLGNARTEMVTVAPPIAVEGAWTVAFQPNRGAPESISLPTLSSLHLHANPGVKYFSGAARYQRDLVLPEAFFAPDHRIVIDLGRVEVVAEVRVNGRATPVLWKEPYRVDVTDLVHPGSNQLEVVVTTLWTNRLIGDEQLPPEDEFGIRDEQGNDPHGIVRLPDWYREGKPKPPGGRVTFATWNFYDKDEPLVASGLLGPVRVFNPVRHVFAE